MLISYELPLKATNFSNKPAIRPNDQSRLLLKGQDLFNMRPNKNMPKASGQYNSVNSTRMPPISSNVSPHYKPMPIEMGPKVKFSKRSLSPIREEKNQEVRMNRVTQNLSQDKPAADPKESTVQSKQQTLKTSSLKTLGKKAFLSVDEKANASVFMDANRMKKLKMSQIKEFNEKYILKFPQGYSNKILEKCISLLSGENDPFVLESLFPGHYTMYTTLNASTSSMDLTNKLSSKLGSLNSERYDSLETSSYYSSNNAGFLPTIRTKRQEMAKEDETNGGTLNTEHNPASRSSLHDSRFSAMSSVFGAAKWRPLPQMEMETFRETLFFYKDFVHKSTLLMIEALYKEASLQLGFCELVWDEGKNNVLQLSKYFVQKVFRKMGMLIPITVKVIDYLFKTYTSVDKLTIEILPKNETMSEPLTLTGFKLERIIIKEDQKWQVLVLRKKEFYQWFQEIVGAPEENSKGEVNFKVTAKGI